MLLPLLFSAFTGCGVTFELPKTWHAEVVDKDTTQCEIGLTPPGWESMRAKSRWHEEDVAISLTRYDLSFEQALEDNEFERDSQGRWGVPGFRSMIDQAHRVRYGAFSGWRSEPMFRAYAKEGAELGDTSRIYSGIEVVIALHDGEGTVVAIRYSQGSPDIKLDRDAAAKVILSSLRRATPPTARTR